MNLDELIKKRRSVRSFTEELVKEEELKAIVEAGRLAPFAGLAQGPIQDFRHFFVIKRGSETAGKLMKLVQEARLLDLKDVEETDLGERYPAYAQVVRNMSGKEPADLFMAPLLVVVAERAGMPAREHVSLGYVLAQMWMKAADLGVAVKISSAVGDIRNTEALKDLLGLDREEKFAFDGCSLGYAAGPLFREEPRAVPLPNLTYLP